jgi:isopenicillin-N epimerase
MTCKLLCRTPWARGIRKPALQSGRLLETFFVSDKQIMSSLREYFLIDPDVIFFNHGSFGAAPRPVFESYQRWQLELERNPVKFIGRRAPALMEEARHALGAYLHTDGDNVIYVTNATFGMNVILRSMKLGPGDEVLTTDHEYGAINTTWNFMAEKLGFRYINHHIPLPVTTAEDFVETLWQGVTPRTRVISLSHITSPTALIFPVELVCKRAREAGIITVIDGAHAPGQIPLNLDEIGADYYVGNLHKWVCAPKGSGFMYARPEMQPALEPLVVSHGWKYDPAKRGSFVSIQQSQGTRDLAAFLAVPDAIRFQQEHDWDRVRAECHGLAEVAQMRMCEAFDLQPYSAPDAQPAWWSQMVAIPLPKIDLGKLGKHLLDDLHMEIPIFSWQDHPLARLSVQAYNTPAEVDTLVRAVTEFAARPEATAA